MGILGSQDIVLIVCSLGSGKVCGPTEVVVFEPSSHDEQESNKQREMWRNTPETQNSTGENNQYNTSYSLETISSQIWQHHGYSNMRRGEK